MMGEENGREEKGEGGIMVGGGRGGLYFLAYYISKPIMNVW